MVVKSVVLNKSRMTGLSTDLTSQPVDRPKLLRVVMTNSDAISNGSDTKTANGLTKGGRSGASNGRPMKRFYIDELGFYRYLDVEERQYVCSNVNLVERQISNSASAAATTQITGADSPRRRISTADQGGESKGIEVHFKTLRNDLGISHFDKTEEYESWKADWDEFMRVKLISQQPVTLNRELKSRVRSGIPHDYRCKVWTALIRMRTRNIRAQFGDDIYELIIRDLVSKADIPDYDAPSTGDDLNNNNNNNNNDGSDNDNLSRKPKIQHQREARSSYITPKNDATNRRTTPNTTMTASSQAPSVQDQQMDKCFRQIELDLLRTLPNNRHFEDPNSIGIKRVRRVLRAYACFNQSVGYCQGMNRLAAMALLVLPEEDAFWCLVAIIQCIMPKDYYLKPWLAQVDCCVLSDLLEKKMPKLHKHLVKNDIQLTLFTWFFTIFVDGFRPELMLRIWDCFLLEGDKVLFRFALAILHICQDDLLQMSDFSTMSSHLSRLVSTRKLDVEHLFETFKTMNPLSAGSLQTKREFHRNKIRSILEE